MVQERNHEILRLGQAYGLAMPRGLAGETFTESK